MATTTAPAQPTLRYHHSTTPGVLYVTENGHGCETWRKVAEARGSECDHGHMLWSHQVNEAYHRGRRAQRADTAAAPAHPVSGLPGPAPTTQAGHPETTTYGLGSSRAS